MHTSSKAISTTILVTALLLSGCDKSGGTKADRNSHGLLNTPPKAEDLNVSLDEDTHKNITLIATDEENDTLRYTISEQPSNGRLQGTPPYITYIPNKDYNGKDSFTYMANDGLEDSHEAKVMLHIVPVADLQSLTLKTENKRLNKGTATRYTIIPTFDEGKVPDTLRHKIETLKPKADKTEHVEINATHIKALQDGNVTLSASLYGINANKVNLNIYWEVDGHRLPPEPDPKINNATLLGVDSNGNGVRDDVERWIYSIETSNTVWALTDMQFTKAYQKILKSPKFETRAYMQAASACLKFRMQKSSDAPKAGIKLLDKVFNTKERIEKYFDYLEDLSGRVLLPPKPDKNACEFN